VTRYIQIKRPSGLSAQEWGLLELGWIRHRGCK